MPDTSSLGRAAVLAYGLLAVALFGYCVSIALRGGHQYVPWLDEIYITVVEVAAALVCVMKAVTSRGSALVVRPLAAGLLLWTIGDVIWQVLSDDGSSVPVPSLADAFYLAFYPLVFFAVVVIVHERSPQAVLGSWLDGLLTALGVAVVCAAFGFDKILMATGGSRIEVLVNLAYPVGDLILLALSVGALAVLPSWDRQGMLLMAGGILFGWSDSTYLFQAAADTYVQGSWVDLGWPTAIFLMSLGAWRSSRSGEARRTGLFDSRLVLPLGAYVIGTGTLVQQALRTGNHLAPVLASIMLVVALTRIVTLFRELRTLELERSLRNHAEMAQVALAREEARSRAMAARLASLVDAAPVGIIEMDAAGLVVRWNPAAERIYGWTEAEMIGTTGPQLAMAEKILTRVSTKVPAAYGTVAVAEEHLRKDGSAVDVEVAIAGLTDDSGSGAGWIKVVTDVSRRMELELLLRHAQKMESIGLLASGVAHEINTPIQFIGDNLHFIEQSFQDLADLCTMQSAVLSGIDDPRLTPAISQVNQLTDDIDLDFLLQDTPTAARQALDGIERVATIVGAMKAMGHPGSRHKSAVDLNDCISSALIVAGHRIKHVARVVTEFADLPQVVCHSGDIQQVILNLLVNAGQAIAEGQQASELGLISVSSRRDGDEAVIEVSDTGPGIPAAIASKVFDPFFTTKPVGIGTGQGLALAHSLIVERHGGTIDFTSSPGSGTTFVVRLPLNLPPAEREP